MGGLNTYTYVGGSPGTRKDSSGKIFFIPLLIGAVAASGDAAAIAGGVALLGGGAIWAAQMSGNGGSDNGWRPSWQDDLDYHDHGAKNEHTECGNDHDKDCKRRLKQLTVMYGLIRTQQIIDPFASTLGSQIAYDQVASRFHKECPYWQRVPLFNSYH